MIAKAAIPLVRESAQEGVSTVAEAIDRVGLDVREGAGRLIGICDLLDAIGWTDEEEPAGDVDATNHAATIKEVLPALLETLRSAVRELTDGDPQKQQVEPELRLLDQIDRQTAATLGR